MIEALGYSNNIFRFPNSIKLHPMNSLIIIIITCIFGEPKRILLLIYVPAAFAKTNFPLIVKLSHLIHRSKKD